MDEKLANKPEVIHSSPIFLVLKLIQSLFKSFVREILEHINASKSSPVTLKTRYEIIFIKTLFKSHFLHYFIRFAPLTYSITGEFSVNFKNSAFNYSVL